ncbi:conserved hypothetical protein [Histoplasma capsulatum G186AR]|uniref:Pre-mRNA-splicing factor 38B n=1 Tax=Ajellomyces capsulatus (strain G186AR / H82 / ATCC MYA-2454 / RMSCC 2432) TaxID=447093 RepID=C0NLR7_AJECG|nr:uncharacterized protein HCBG_04447 [Histoplasma capsulatum G186AR]EEH07568.1 conserved hypothetical protein [Histoplasma capsulatum G186AR]
MSKSKEAGSVKAPDLNDDEYVAQLLAKDARDSSLRYSAIGMSAFAPLKRPSARVPKPNTRFLKNILRETDIHNASLKKKEEEEARGRMRALRHENGRSSGSKQERDLHNVNAAKRRRVEATLDQKYEREDCSKRQNGKDEGNRHTSRDRERERGREKRSDQRMRGRRYDENSDDDDKPGRRTSSKSRHHKREDNRPHRIPPVAGGMQNMLIPQKSTGQVIILVNVALTVEGAVTVRRLKDLNESHDEHPRTGTDCTATPLRDKLPAANGGKSPTHRQTSTHHGGPDSVSPSRKLDTIDPSDSDPGSDSDPLESLIGPLPPPAENEAPPLRSRGRGAYKNKSNIDAHFASGYDPLLDVQPDDDDGDGYGNTTNPKNHIRRRPVAGLARAEDDDWDMALEALRDRALWRRKGADRLREAGFDEGIIEKWASNRAFVGLDGGANGVGHRDIGRDRDRDVEDVRWVKQGEKREWDRGKVLTDDGRVDVRPEW